jgi:hypothetical protein
MIPAQPDKSRDFINVSILLTVAVCVGIYLIITTAIIAKDGVTFIKYAKQIEAAPVKTMVNEFQHPGYPLLILTAHKATQFLHQNISILSWIYCGQSITLIFRLLAITTLYFIGKQLFGAKLSFWGVLILILLPKPAEYGSDALSDWPHLFFFTAGLLLLFKGAANKRWWIFGFAGLAAGAGYLIRPECAMLVVLGGLWLGLQLLWSKRTMSINKVLPAIALLIIGFLIIAGPYMKLKGAIFPKKDVGRFTQDLQQEEVCLTSGQITSDATEASTFTPTNTVKAFGKLVGNIGETLMWFFVPALLIGMCKWFKGRKWYEPEKFFVIAIIVLNVPVMIWLYCKHGYMSDRHTLPLLIIPILYAPVGLQELAIWLRDRFSKKAEPSAAINHNERLWFLVLFLIGICICAPKLLKPIRMEKQGYRAAAKWLKANTDSTATAAVPDIRINFYAQREGLVYENGSISRKADYIVKLQNKKDETALTEPPGKVEYEYIDKTKKGISVIIYRNM